MKKQPFITIIFLAMTLLAPRLQAWYPDYSVLATDLPVRDDFLRPLSLHSTTLLGMGEYFQFIYPAQPDLRFMDPSYPLGDSRHVFYMDLGAEPVWESAQESSGYPPVLYDARSSMSSDYGFWSPYRELSHENIPEPSLRLFYLTRLGHSDRALTLGGSYSLAYDETQFYQPYNYDYFRGGDALGAAYDESQVYEDYRLRESGQDESVSTEHQLNLFVSKPLSAALSLGARIGILRADVDGSYGDFQFYDHSDWSDEYESYWDDDTKRLQSVDMNDIALGLSYTTPQQNRFALSGGFTSGSLDRSFNEFDSSRYHSITLNPDGSAATADTNIYLSSSYYASDREWQYEGSGKYLRFMAELPQSQELMLRFGGSLEWRSADLTESESMLRRSDYFNQYWADWDNLWHRYSSRSMATVERQGTGKYSSELIQLSGGVDWQLQPALKFYGGLFLEHYDRSQDSREPFAGEKTAYTSLSGYNYPYAVDEAFQTDLKTFIWKQHQWRTTLAAPVGIEYQVLPAIGVQLGLTKVFQRLRVEEGYDVIVEEYHFVEQQDDVTIRDDLDTEYVDGYEYPVIRDFRDSFDFNAGLNIRSGDKLCVSVILTKLTQNEYAIKVGGSLTW